MPDYRASQAALRRGYSFNGYLSTPSEVSVLRGTMTANAADGAQFLSYTTTSGSHGNVADDMEVIITSSSDVYKGRLRVAPSVAGNTLSSTHLPVNEFSLGRIKVVVGDKLNVVRSWRLRDYLVGATATFPKDSRIEYVDQLETLEPVANNGGLWVGMADMMSDANFAPQFFGSRSIVLDNDNSLDLLLHAHDVKDGTITAGTSGSADITATFPTGERWIDYTCADGVVSSYYTKHAWVRVHDENDPPIAVVTSERTYTRDAGARFRFTVPSSAAADIDYLPEGALIVYWKEEWYDDVRISYGSSIPSRHHIKFVGFLVRESIKYNDAGEVAFEAVAPIEILKSGLTAWSQVVDEKDFPTSWQQLQMLSIQRMLWYIVRWGTSFLRTFDLTMPFTDLYYSGFRLQESTPYSQLLEVAKAASCLVGSTREGHLNIALNPKRMTLAERSGLTIALDLTASDIRVDENGSGGGIEASWEHRLKFRSLTGKGFTSDTSDNIPLKSEALSSPAESPDATTEERLIVSSLDGQAGLNKITELALADYNGTYNGLTVPVGAQIHLLPGLDVLDVGVTEWITLTHTPDTDTPASRRNFSMARFLPMSVSVRENADTGTQDVDITADHETFGVGAVAIPIETDTGISFPVDSYPVPTSLNNTSGLSNAISRGTKRLALIGTLGIGRTEDALTPAASGGPTWAVSLWSALLSSPGTAGDWTPDGFNPGYGWLTTHTKVWYINLAALTGSLKKTFSVAANRPTYSADASISERNFFAVIRYIDSGGISCCVTVDNITFNEVVVDSHYATDGGGLSIMPGCVIDSRTPGRILTSAFTSTSTVSPAAIGMAAKTSDDHGSTWGATPPFSMSQSPSVILAQVSDVPWNNNPSRNIGYWAYTNALMSGTARLMCSTGASQAEITPSIAGIKFAPRAQRSGIKSHDSNRQRLLCVGQQAPVPGYYAAFLSYDAGGSWIVVDGSGSNFRRGAWAGDSQATGWFFGVNNAVSRFALSGSTVTLDSMTGNLASLSSIGDILGIAGY